MSRCLLILLCLQVMSTLTTRGLQKTSSPFSMTESQTRNNKNKNIWIVFCVSTLQPSIVILIDYCFDSSCCCPKSFHRVYVAQSLHVAWAKMVPHLCNLYYQWAGGRCFCSLDIIYDNDTWISWTRFTMRSPRIIVSEKQPKSCNKNERTWQNWKRGP